MIEVNSINSRKTACELKRIFWKCNKSSAFDPTSVSCYFKGEANEDSLVVKTKISANQNMKFLGKNGKKFQEDLKNSKTINKYLIEIFG